MEKKKVESYKDLIVWKKSYELVKIIYEITSKLPKNETYGLQSQIQRSAVSVPSNIAEGFCRRTPKDFRQFLHTAFGSVGELGTQLLLCKDLYNVDTEKAERLLEEVSKMLRAFIGKLDTKD